MPAVPVDEVGGGDASGEVLTGHVEPAVDARARCVNDGVVALGQLRVGNVPAELHAADEAHLRALQDFAQRPGDAFDLGVVGGDAVAHQPVGRGEPVQHVNGDRLAFLPGQGVRSVDPGGAGPDHRDAQGGG